MTKTRIMVVEDDDLVAEVIQRSLELLGYDVTLITATGEEALQHIDTAPPDLVMMDVMLKGSLDGIETAAKIRQHHDIPILFVTAHSDAPLLRRAKLTEPFGYILKPFKEKDLQAGVEMALYKHKIEQELARHRHNLEVLVAERTAELETINQQFQQEVARSRQMEEQIFRNAFYDALTGLPNRALFIDHLERSIGHAKRNVDYKFAVLFLNLDRFQVITDSLGYDLADELLIIIGRRLQKCTRYGDTVARFNADQFLILLDDIKNVSEVLRIVQNIHDQVKMPIKLINQEMSITTSIGIVLNKSHHQTNHQNPDDFLRDASAAMHQAKDKGRGKFILFDIGLHARALANLNLEADLRQAIKKEEFLIYYQPIVSLSSNQITGVEALLRWRHAEYGFISPEEFIPVLEETGMIIPITEWVIRNICTQVKAWHQAGYTSLRCAVNLSIHQLKEVRLPTLIQNILRQVDLPAKAIELEVTETIAASDNDLSVSTLNKLKKIGVHISIDDFGTGYSSLGRLKRMPVHNLKIDQSFIRDMTDDTNDRAIVTAIIAMAHKLNLNVIAEGVENLEQLNFLRTLHCDEVQGFLFSEALPPAQMTDLLHKGVSVDPERKILL